MASLPPKPNPRRGRSAAREKILTATEWLLLEHGVEGCSIRALSERCGYSAPTIYHHFGDKTGLINELLDERFREALAVMRAVERGLDPGAYLRALAHAYADFALKNPNHYRLISTPRLEQTDLLPSVEEARALVKGALEELAGQSRLATDDVEAAFQVTWAMLHGILSLHMNRPDYDFAPNLLDLALDTVDRGLLHMEVRDR